VAGEVLLSPPANQGVERDHSWVVQASQLRGPELRIAKRSRVRR